MGDLSSKDIQNIMSDSRQLKSLVKELQNTVETLNLVKAILRFLKQKSSEKM